MSNNPLLEISDLPNHAPAFDKIKDEHYLPAVEAAIEIARKNVDAIKADTNAPTFDNTILALDNSSEALGQPIGIFYNQLSVMGGDALHDLAEKIGPLSAAFSSDISLDPVLFQRVKTVYDKRESLDLTPEKSMLLDDTYKSFVRSGALLDDNKQARLREIAHELSTISPAFMNNVSKSSEAFELLITKETEIAGLPEGAITAARHMAEEKGYKEGWLITLDFPSYLPFMQFADARELREQVWNAFGNRAYKDEWDNCANVLKIVSLKYERAQLLGYDTHADYVLEERMAKTPETVQQFLAKLKAAYQPEAIKDLKTLREFAEETDGLLDLQPWDFGYYAEKLKQKLFDFSSEDLRPYFQLDKVLSGCFAHFTKLFGITFKENKDYPVWHKDVQTFDLHRASDGVFIGTLYGDFFPRTGKKPGAWKTAYRNQGLFNGKIERPVISIVCNFTKPTKDKPALITHGEVTTLFHEMGHAMHALLSDVTYRSLAGTSVKWDFVELPSQLQENWCFEKETLDLFAEHYETGEKIPQELIDKLRAAKNFMGGWAGLRQVNLATLDMAWHSQDPSLISNVAAFEDAETADTSLFPRLSGPSSTSFSHIFAGGYSAGYYSYKWAEVLDADAFELFLTQGLYDQRSAKRYQTELLSKGGSIDPDQLYHNFRGRDADPDALFRREGLLGKAKGNKSEKAA